MLLTKTARLGVSSRIGFSAVALLAVGALPAFAQTLTPYDSGSVTKTAWYTAPGFDVLLGETLSHDPASTAMNLENSFNCNYLRCDEWDTVRTNSYALFDVPAALGAIASVELKFNLQRFGDYYYEDVFGGEPVAVVFEWQAWDVSSPPAEFQVAYSGIPTAPGLALLADLGSGIQYAGGTSQGGGGAVSVQLQGAALADLAAAQGGVFGIGFTVPRSYINICCTVTASFSEVQLVVTTIPEPRTAALMLLGMGALLAAVRRRRH